MKESDFFFTRHTLRPDPPTKHDPALPESERYGGITEPGVELAKERTQEIISIIDSLPDDGILFISGGSDLERTKSTGEVYGDTLAEHYVNEEGVVVLTRSQINSMREEAKESEGRVLDDIQEKIDSNPAKKIVIAYPLFLKEFSLTPGFIDPKTKKKTPYAEAMFKAGEGYEDKAAKVFLQSEGEVKIEGETITGITAQEIGENHLKGIKRLQEFASKFANGREVVVGIVGHAWTLDSFVSYLANDGVAGKEGWDKVGDKMIDKTEMGRVLIKGDAVTFNFRGKDYPISPELLK